MNKKLYNEDLENLLFEVIEEDTKRILKATNEMAVGPDAMLSDREAEYNDLASFIEAQIDDKIKRTYQDTNQVIVKISNYSIPEVLKDLLSAYNKTRENLQKILEPRYKKVGWGFLMVELPYNSVTLEVMGITITLKKEFKPSQPTPRFANSVSSRVRRRPDEMQARHQEIIDARKRHE